jgi:hypothetical protein
MLIQSGEAVRALLPERRTTKMHDLMIAAIFIAMVLAPCITATRSGAASTEEKA